MLMLYWQTPANKAALQTITISKRVAPWSFAVHSPATIAEEDGQSRSCQRDIRKGGAGWTCSNIKRVTCLSATKSRCWAESSPAHPKRLLQPLRSSGEGQLL